MKKIKITIFATPTAFKHIDELTTIHQALRYKDAVTNFIRDNLAGSYGIGYAYSYLCHAHTHHIGGIEIDGELNANQTKVLAEADTAGLAAAFSLAPESEVVEEDEKDKRIKELEAENKRLKKE